MLHEAVDLMGTTYHALYLKASERYALSNGIYARRQFDLGAVHKCQHFHECTNHTLSETPSSQRVHINIVECQKSP